MKTCPRVPLINMYMDLHYAAPPLKEGGGRKRRLQRGGNASFTVIDHIVSLGLDADAFQTACRAGWEVIARLGQGAFGSVDHIRVNMPEGPHNYVVKTLHICPGRAERYARHEYDAHKYLMDVQTFEPTDLLIDNIIPAIALAETNTPTGKKYHIFFEREEGTSLDSFIETKLLLGQKISLDEQEEIATSLNDALRTIHRAKIIHRDIKPANLFIITNPDPIGIPKYKIKLIDFGLAIRTNAGPQPPGVGTLSYLSDEHNAVLQLYIQAASRGEDTDRFRYIYSPADDMHAMHITNNKVMDIVRFSGPPQGPPPGWQPQVNPLLRAAAPSVSPVYGPLVRGSLIAVSGRGHPRGLPGAVGRRRSLPPLNSTRTGSTTNTTSSSHGYMPLPTRLNMGMAVNPNAFAIGNFSSIPHLNSHSGGSTRRVKQRDRGSRRKSNHYNK